MHKLDVLGGLTRVEGARGTLCVGVMCLCVCVPVCFVCVWTRSCRYPFGLCVVYCCSVFVLFFIRLVVHVLTCLI